MNWKLSKQSELGTHIWNLSAIILNPFCQFFIKFFSLKNLFSVYLFLRERQRQRQRQRQSVSVGGAERERENLQQAPGSELSAQSPAWGSKSQTLRSWPELKLDA